MQISTDLQLLALEHDHVLKNQFSIRRVFFAKGCMRLPVGGNLDRSVAEESAVPSDREAQSIRVTNIHRGSDLIAVAMLFTVANPRRAYTSLVAGVEGSFLVNAICVVVDPADGHDIIHYVRIWRIDL